MPFIQADSTRGAVACRGFRGIQSMRRSRSTSALCKPHGKGGTTRDSLISHGFKPDGVATKLLQSTLGTLGLDLMLPPVALSADWKPKVDASQDEPCTNHKEKIRSVPVKSAPPPLGVSSQGISDMSKPRCRERMPDVRIKAGESWTQALAFPGYVEHASCKWRCFGQDVSSFEEVYRMTFGELTSDGSTVTTGANTTTTSLLRCYYANAIHFYEEYLLAGGSEDAMFDDEHRASKQCQLMSISTNHKCWTLFCREITAYEELYSTTGEDPIELDNVFVASSRATTLGKPSGTVRFHFFSQPIHSYDDLYNMLGSAEFAFDEDAASELPKEQISRGLSFFGMGISSYEELYALVGEDGAILDADGFGSSKADQIASSSERAFYCTTVHSFEHFLFLARDLTEVFDDESHTFA